MYTGISFLFFYFEYLFNISKSAEAKPNQHLNKFYTPKWKTKTRSFLVTPKGRFGEVLENFMLQISNHPSQTIEFIVWDVWFHVILKHFLFNLYVDLVYQLEMLLHDKIRPCALEYHVFLLFWISFEYFKIGRSQTKSAFPQVLHTKMEN